MEGCFTSSVWLYVEAPSTTPSKHSAPPRPLPTTEAGRRQSSGVPAPQQPAAVQSHVPPRSTSTSTVSPVGNNNVVYGNTNDVIDWTDDEWDDDDDDGYDEEMQVIVD